MTYGREALPTQGITGIDTFNTWISRFRSRVIEYCPPEQIVERPAAPMQKIERYFVTLLNQPWGTLPDQLKVRLIEHDPMIGVRTLPVSIKIDRSRIFFLTERPDAIDPTFDLIKNLSPEFGPTLQLEDARGIVPRRGDWLTQGIPEQDQAVLKNFAESISDQADVTSDHKRWVNSRLPMWGKAVHATADELKELADYLKENTGKVILERYFVSGGD